MVVDPFSLKDKDNCRCIQCAVTSLVNGCFAEHCGSRKQLPAVNNLLKYFSGLETQPNAIPKEKVSSSKLSYYKENDQLYRNLLSFERHNLIESVVNTFKGLEEQDKSEFSGLKFWKKKTFCRKPKPEDDEGDDEDEEEEQDCPLKTIIEPTTTTVTTTEPNEWVPIHTQTKTRTSFVNHTPVITVKVPKVVEKTVRDCTKTDCTNTQFKTERYTLTETKTSHDTIRETKFKTKTNYEYETIRDIKTKYRHDFVTVTETELELKTRTKYRFDIATATETEVEEVTRTIKVGKVTVTDYDTITEYDDKTSYTTETETKYKVKLKKKKTTVTSVSWSTAIATTSTTFTKTKKLWIPRTRTLLDTTTIISTVVTTTLATTTVPTTSISTATVTTTETIISVSVPGMLRVPMLTNIKFGVFSASDNNNNAHQKFVTKGVSPKPSSVPRFTPAVEKRGLPMNTINGTKINDGRIFSQRPHYPVPYDNVKNISNFTIQYNSQASQLEVKFIWYTVFVVSVCTLTFFSKGTHSGNFTEVPSKLTAEDEYWSELDTEITDEEFMSLSVHIPWDGLSLEEVAKQLRVD